MTPTLGQILLVAVTLILLAAWAVVRTHFVTGLVGGYVLGRMQRLGATKDQAYMMGVHLMHHDPDPLWPSRGVADWLAMRALRWSLRRGVRRAGQEAVHVGVAIAAYGGSLDSDGVVRVNGPGEGFTYDFGAPRSTLPPDPPAG